MSIAPQRKMKANFARTIEADEDTCVSSFLMDHGLDRRPDEYNIWINRRRVGGEAEIERGGSRDHRTAIDPQGPAALGDATASRASKGGS
jgi:hypothetical protein